MKNPLLLAIFLLLGVGQLHARTPTASDRSFCDGYAVFAQSSFSSLNAGKTIADDLRTITSDPLAAWYSRAVTFGKQPMAGTTDITAQARGWCLTEVNGGIYPTIPGDPEAEAASRREWVDDWRLPGGLPPASETFTGRYQVDMNQLSSDVVMFKRHDAQCSGKLGATFANGSHDCDLVSDGSGFLIGKSGGDGGTGQVRVPFTSTRPIGATNKGK
jgi:hypothetical protein